MDNVVADTNVVIWYFTNPTRLSKLAEQHLDAAALSGTIMSLQYRWLNWFISSKKESSRNKF